MAAVEPPFRADTEVTTRSCKGAAVFLIDGAAERVDLGRKATVGRRGASTAPPPLELKGAVQVTTPTRGAVQGKFS